MSSFLILAQMLDARLESSARSWLKKASAEIGDEVSNQRFSALLSMASRHAKDRQLLEPTEAERKAAEKALEGWNPERWTLLESLRVCLVLYRTDLSEESAAIAIEEAFSFADEGEQRALYRSLAHLPDGERFVWRAGEGCRSNMQSVFEANVLDTPFPALHFDALAFEQAVIKCVFMGAPLWRLWGLDGRLTESLCHMALDLADERRSAGRPIQGDLWLCLGEQLPERSLEALEAELEAPKGDPHGQVMAFYGLLRAGHTERAQALAASPQFSSAAGLKQPFAAALAGTSVYDYCASRNP